MTDTTMRAITISDDGTLRWAQTARPVPGPGEVLLKVHATAVNRADLMQRRGLYPPPPGASEILGLEAAGEVVAAHDEDDARAWVGRRAATLLTGGGYAEYVRAPASLLLAVPDAMHATVAAAIPEVYTTAYLNLFIEGGLRRGQSALIHAGASGVGTAALQLCARFGVEAFATASGSKLDLLRSLGAVAIDRREEDFLEVVRARTGGAGVDVILDPVGGDYLTRNIEALAPRGALVLIGLMGGARGELPLGRLLVKRLRVIGSVLRSRSVEEKAAIMDAVRREVWPALCAGELEPIIDQVMPITQAHEAHELVGSDTTQGKVVLTVG